MPNYRDYLDELFIDKLGYNPDFQTLVKPAIDGIENLVSLHRDYLAPVGNVAVIVAECKDRLPYFQKDLIKAYKKTYPDAHFLFISNGGRVFDLYNFASSKKLTPITYNEIDRNTKLFKEKVQFFNANAVAGSGDLFVQIEKAFTTSDKITKKFYDNFKGLHEKLTDAIEGIDDEGERRWYATTLLNRIMFIFFLQKNYVLQNDPDYLLSKFDRVNWKGGNYYKDFLLPLFFKGFAKKDADPDKQDFVKEYGEVRYLNGGLFYPNKIEMKLATEKKEKVAGVLVKVKDETEPQIEIANGALHDVLKFLNGYAWYLDSRPLKNEKEVNPDILGYIFERYINYKDAGQKELGAYYTKEDITEYISKNTIIPFIFDKLRSNGFDAPDPTPLITANEDIIAATESYITGCEDYQTLKFLYKDVLQLLSVLDPAVGSGAFLFAALSILLPIYQATVARLKTFAANGDSWLLGLLKALKSHPEEYYLTKQIILNNLYGVDIVEEGVEICKLRLFLQLASHLPDIQSIEPLPDIDFNIYAGNSLVGGLSWEDLLGNYGLKLFTKDGDAFTQEELATLIDDMKAAKRQYKTLQADEDDEVKLKAQKKEIERLEHRINHCIDVGIENPFHWFVEYADIFERGGFDAVIGNPPYLGTSKINYSLAHIKMKVPDIYGTFIYRSVENLLHKDGKLGFIVMHSLAFSKHFQEMRNFLKNREANGHFSFYGRIPSGLFSGDVRVRNCILLYEKNKEGKKHHTTRLHRWFTEDRSKLFANLCYTAFDFVDVVPMFNDKRLASFFQNNKSPWIKTITSKRLTKHVLHYKKTGYNWVGVSEEPPPAYDIEGNEITQPELSELYFLNDKYKKLSLLLFNGKMFFSHWLTFGDEFHITKTSFELFKIDYSQIEKDDLSRLEVLYKDFKKNLPATIQYKLNKGKEVGNFNSSKLWHITDESDFIFLKYMSKNSKEVFSAINQHVKATVISDVKEEDDEE